MRWRARHSCTVLSLGRTRALLSLSLLASVLAVGCGQTTPQIAPPHGLLPPPRVDCNRYAATQGSDSAPGSRARPFRTPQRLADALHPGQTGCFRGGTYTFSQTTVTTPITLAPYGNEAVTLKGTIKVIPGGASSTIEGMQLDGAGGISDIGPRIYADKVVLRNNEITNEHTSICVSISAYYSNPPPQGVVIEGNRIHDCGALPSTNKDHGIYVTDARDTVIRNNWIYDNVDRGVQLYPDAQHTRIIGNVIDGNGEAVVFSGEGDVTSNDNLVEGNIITDSRLGWNVYSGQSGPVATGNLLRNNCVWAGESSSDYGSNGGVETPSRNFTANGNAVVDPHYSDPAAGDYTLSSESQCPLAKQLYRPAFAGPS
jgi:nitrous oxidase accessory protein NosD